MTLAARTRQTLACYSCPSQRQRWGRSPHPTECPGQMSRFLGTVKQIASGWSVTQVSVLLTAVALALWAFSLGQVRLEIGRYGLISGFPAIFFVALGILTLATVLLWVSPEKHHKLLFLQLMVLITAVWLVPLLFGTRPYFRDAFGILQHLDGVAAEGRVAIDGYLKWPGAFLFFGMLGKLGSMSLDSAMNVSSFIMLLLYLPPLYVFLHNILGESRSNFCWAGLWVFSLASWVPEGYFSPQGVAYFLFLVMLALITTHGFWERGRKWLMLTVSLVVVGAAIVLTHLLTTALAIATLAAASVAKKSLRAVPIIVAVAALAVLWNVVVTQVVGDELGTTPLLATPSPASSGEAAGTGLLNFDVGSMVEQQVLEPVSSGSQSHIDVARIRVAFAALVAALAVAGVIYLLAKRERRTAILLIAIAAVPFLLLPISGQVYAVAYATRLYFFLVPTMAGAAVFLLMMRKRLAVPFFWAICTAAIPLIMIAQYGNQAMDRWSPSFLDGTNYVSTMRTAGNYPFAGLDAVALNGDQVVLDSELVAKGYYFPISRRDDAIYTFKYDRPDFVDGVWTWLNSSREYDHLYVNPEYSLYFFDGTEDES